MTLCTWLCLLRYSQRWELRLFSAPRVRQRLQTSRLDLEAHPRLFTASHDPFIHNVARPHKGQVEVAKNVWDLLEGSSLATRGEEKELSIEEDEGILRQDRYSLRTAPQFLGPQLEDLLSALDMVTQECNSSKFLFFLFATLKPSPYPFSLSHRQPAR